MQPSIVHYSNLKTVISELATSHDEIGHEVSRHIEKHHNELKRRREELALKLSLQTPLKT